MGFLQQMCSTRVKFDKNTSHEKIGVAKLYRSASFPFLTSAEIEVRLLKNSWFHSRWNADMCTAVRESLPSRTKWRGAGEDAVAIPKLVWV